MKKENYFVLLSEPSTGTIAKASSVLQKNVKQYGPMNVLDYENALSCWNSEGDPKGKTSSHLIIHFGREVIPKELHIQFQAGFVAEEMKVLRCLAGADNREQWIEIDDFEVDDDHEVQLFHLAEQGSSIKASALKLIFEECTDFYGRITIYKLQVWGQEVDGTEK